MCASLRVLLSRIAVGAAVLALAGCGARRVSYVPGAGVAVWPEHGARSVAALGWPGFRRAFQFGDGAQIGAGEGAIAWSLATDESVRVSPVYFEADGVPVAHQWLLTAHDSLAIEAAAFAVPGATDTLLVASVRVSVWTRAGAPSTTPVRLDLRDELAGPHARPWDAPPAPDAAWLWRDGRALRAGRVVGALAHVSAWRLETGADATSRLRATSGTGNVFALWLPERPVSEQEASCIAAHLEHDAHVSRVRAAWRAALASGTRLATPDALVAAAWRAARVTLLVGQERAGSGWVPIGNPFQYRDTWIRDGARVIRSLALAGDTTFAREDALALTRYALENGALLSQPGQLDGPGEALWAFEQAASLPPSAAWSRRFLPVAAAGGRWLAAQRVGTDSLSRQMRIDWPGLLPFADPRDGELVRAPLVGNDAWAIAGQRALAAMAERAGDVATRDAALAEARAHAAAFAAALARTGAADVPAAWSGAARDWGNAAVGWPTRALPADDPRLARFWARTWATSGLHMASYGTPDSLHAYLGADAGGWALLADRAADARAALAAMLAHSSATLGQAEIVSRASRDFGANLPPHGTAAAAVIELIRDAIVFDARDTLELAAGGDLAWWRGTRLERAPTRFGAIDVALEAPAPDRLVVRWSRPATRVPMRVRVPDGVRLERIEGAGTFVPGGHWVDAAGDSLVLHVRPS